MSREEKIEILKRQIDIIVRSVAILEAAAGEQIVRLERVRDKRREELAVLLESS